MIEDDTKKNPINKKKLIIRKITHCLFISLINYTALRKINYKKMIQKK